MFRSFEFAVKTCLFLSTLFESGRAELRRNHKSNCSYAHCRCAECFLVERRRELNTRLHSLETSNDLEEHSGRCVVDAQSSSGFQLLQHQRLKGEDYYFFEQNSNPTTLTDHGQFDGI
ncbi:DM DNA binding domain protein [Aphelenchoides besseyi]|nr:DM DNA binding domain protein [Aphelenchoides besseyi]